MTIPVSIASSNSAFPRFRVPRAAGPVLGTCFVLAGTVSAQALGLRGTLDSAGISTTPIASAVNTGNGVLGTGVTVATTAPGQGVLGTGLAVDTTNTGNGVLGTGVTVGTTAPGQGALGTGLAVNTTNTGNGVLGTGVTVSTPGVGNGVLGTGVAVGTTGAGITGDVAAQTAALNLRLTNVAGAVDAAAATAATNVAAVASGVNAVAVGYVSTAAGVAATAIGTAAAAAGDASVALGVNANASQNNTIAIGQNARSTRSNQVVIGNTANTYTMTGLSSSESRAAQSGPTTFVTTDAGGNLAASNYGPSTIAGLDGRVSSLDGRVSGLEGSVAGLQATTARLQRDVRTAFQGTAIAMSLAGAVLPAGKAYAISANFGTYHGETGFGASGIARLTDNVYASGGVGFAVSGRTNVGGRGGVTFAW